MGARLGVLGKPFALEATPGMVAALAEMKVVMSDHDGKELARGTGAKVRYEGLPGNPTVSVSFR